MTHVTPLWTGLCVAMFLSFAARPMDKPTQSHAREVRIEVVDFPRPVSAAVLQVERHFGRVVTYEDLSYVAPGEIVDVTEEVRRDGRVSKRVLSMRSHSISLAYTPRESSAEAQVEEVLAQLLAEWNGSGHSGEFRAETVEGGHHVIPVARKGKSGSTEAYTSPLDTPITIPYEERDGLETMFVVARAISDSAGRRVNPGMMPMNRLSRARVVVGAQNQTAREVLWGALQTIDKALSWQVLCDVGESAACAINIHLVRQGS